ncbi:glucoamylase family protein [Paludisphaera mucosa]|uniref:Glucoamylase family protein n=1 Tax=Paludisphaera mucosa TaxID=3030827 RepID=A0ABT6F651_9BACT|nr:glucoamylase family protein [Paludisphaera mucosa]MDG3003060.1 glucoamylase family protein [Paludisphaera mucosa]
MRRYAADTWRSMEKLAFPSGLPSDRVHREGPGWREPVPETTPTNIAAYIWSVIAAERLEIISHDEARERLTRTIQTLEAMNRPHGFFANDIDPRSGKLLSASPVDASPRRPLISTVDNAWMAMALMMVVNIRPDLAPSANRLLDAMDFGFLYDFYDDHDPIHQPGLLRVGYWVDENSFYGHYGMLNTEARMASYIAIARGQLPPDHYYRMYRTLPTEVAPQEQTPTGDIREYKGVKVFEGAYNYLDMRVVPSWGGSMFEALMVTLFVPEAAWAPNSWGVNHPLYVRGQIEHGLREMKYGYWGFSPAFRPTGGYEVYGVKGLGTNPDGYLSFDAAWGLPPHMATLTTGSIHGVVTPHAAFLALPFAPREAMDNIYALKDRFPVYGPLGFQDSVDVSSGMVSGYVLALDQGMIMAAIANELADDFMQKAFTTGPVEKAIRPLVAVEEFTAGAPGRYPTAHHFQPQLTRLSRNVPEIKR